MLGHTIDHRIRVTLGHAHGAPVRDGVQYFRGLWAESDDQAVVHAAVLEAGQQMLAELDTYIKPPLVLPGTDGERLLRLCFVASQFERVFRSGDVEESDFLAQATPVTTLASLLDQVPGYAMADIGAQVQLADHEDALGWMVNRDGTCGPTFAGSDHVGGADADFIYEHELIDCKATVKPRSLGVRELYQLAGYLLLDYPDDYGIRVVSLYLSRQGAAVTWGVEEFLGVMGASKSLTELRQALAETLAVDETGRPAC